MRGTVAATFVALALFLALARLPVCAGLSVPKWIQRAQPAVENATAEEGLLDAADDYEEEDFTEKTLRIYGDDCSVENAIFMDGLTPTKRDELYKGLEKRKKWLCMLDATGKPSYFGFPESTIDIKTQEEVFSNITPTFTDAKARLKSGMSCVQQKTNDIKRVNQVYIDFLKKIGAPKQGKHLQNHMNSVFCNKRNTFRRDGRTQIGDDTSSCWDDAYVPIYVAYSIGVMSKLNKHDAAKRQISARLGLTEQLDAYSRMIERLSDDELREKSEAFLTDYEAKRVAHSLVMNNTSRSIFGGPCSPICKLLVGTSGMFWHSQLVSCCSMCRQTWCNVGQKTKHVLSNTRSASLTKNPPFKIRVFRLNV